MLTSCCFVGWFLRLDLGRMRLMAGVAGKTAGMVRSYHLWEPLWFGAVGLVATRTKDSGIKLCWLNAGIVGMAGKCTVTGLASNDNVFALALLLDNVGVSGLTGLVTGVDDGFRCDVGDGCTAEVSVLAKALGDDGCAHDHKCQQADQNDS